MAHNDEVAHYQPPHQDLHCLQIYQFLPLALKKDKDKLSEEGKEDKDKWKAKEVTSFRTDGYEAILKYI